MRKALDDVADKDPVVMWARIADMANDAIKFEILARVCIFLFRFVFLFAERNPEFTFAFREPLDTMEILLTTHLPSRPTFVAKSKMPFPTARQNSKRPPVSSVT